MVFAQCITARSDDLPIFIDVRRRGPGAVCEIAVGELTQDTDVMNRIGFPKRGVKYPLVSPRVRGHDADDLAMRIHVSRVPLAWRSVEPDGQRFQHIISPQIPVCGLVAVVVPRDLARRTDGDGAA